MRRTLVMVAVVVGVMLTHVGIADACHRRGQNGGCFGGYGGCYGGGVGYGGCYGGGVGYGGCYGGGVGYGYGYTGYGSSAYAGNGYASPYYAGSAQPAYSGGMYYAPNSGSGFANVRPAGNGQGGTQSQSFYSGPNGNTSATVRVQTPADAQVWFGDSPTQQQGTLRVFQSPPLDSKGNYTYTIKARWMNNGQPVERTRQIAVQAGQEVTVDFMDQQDQSRDPAKTNPLPIPQPSEKQEKKSDKQDG